jgi:hypothetical protein
MPDTQRYDSHMPHELFWCGWHQCPKLSFIRTRTILCF